MLESIFHKRIQQHGGQVQFPLRFLNIDPNLDFVRLVQPHPLQVQEVVQILDFLPQRNALLVILVQHEAHHVTEFLDAVRRFFAAFFQGYRVQSVKRVEQEMRIDLGAEGVEFGGFLKDLGLKFLGHSEKMSPQIRKDKAN